VTSQRHGTAITGTVGTANAGRYMKAQASLRYLKVGKKATPHTMCELLISFLSPNI
jgi:hypothetical protein